MPEDRTVRYAEKTGKAFMGPGPAIKITVHIKDTGRGSLPVTVEWPFFCYRFTSLLQVRREFMPLSQFGEIPVEVKNLVSQCLDELGVEHVRPY